MQLAYKKVVANKGKSGIDRMTVADMLMIVISMSKAKEQEIESWKV
ncbi:hypothetical protein [Clostridium sp. Marseille-Q2269]|nr:hypothetical protein [Clostridium sp. Marseille-Q2269]